jgi:hypothetical protein
MMSWRPPSNDEALALDLQTTEASLLLFTRGLYFATSMSSMSRLSSSLTSRPLAVARAVR